MVADLVLFDPETVSDRATPAAPLAPSTSAIRSAAFARPHATTRLLYASGSRTPSPGMSSARANAWSSRPALRPGLSSRAIRAEKAVTRALKV